MKHFISIFMISGLVTVGLAGTDTVSHADSAWGPAPNAGTQSATPPASGNKNPSTLMQPGSMEALARQLMSDPKAMALIENLKNDPAMQKILSDPELMKAVQEKDLGRIARDPNIQALEKNPSLQKLLQKTP